MKPQKNPTDFVYIPLRVELYAELVGRSGKADVSNYINNSVEGFLDSTEGDPSNWSEEYLVKFAKEKDGTFIKKYGQPSRGYQWQNVFLPNGTEIRMTYKGETTYAEIRHEKLILGDESMSPSEFACAVANNTSRNAWRDLYIKYPGSGDWKFAHDVRRQNQ